MNWLTRAGNGVAQLAVTKTKIVIASAAKRSMSLDRFEPAQLHRQEEAMMLLDPPVERRDQIGALAPQLALGEIRHRLGRGLALDQRPEHRAAGHAEDIAGDARQLDVSPTSRIRLWTSRFCGFLWGLSI